MKRHLFKILVILLFTQALFAESITLKSGKKIEGKITEKTDQYIKIEVDQAPIYYERKFIASIDEGKDLTALSPKEGAALTDVDYFKNGLKYGSEAKFQEAEQEFKQGLSVNPNSHNLKEAVKVLEKLNSQKVSPDYATRLFKGSYHLMNYQFEEAISEFKSALEINPDPDIYYYLGVCNYSSGKYEGAIDYFKKALAEIKEDSEIYYNLGASYFALGQYADAVTSLQRAVELNPEDAESYGALGTSHFLSGQWQEAKGELYKAKELFRKRGDYLKAADVETFIKQLNW